MSFSSFDNRLFSSSVFVISKKIKWHQNLRFCFLTCPMTACPTDIRIFYIYHGLLSIHIYLRVKRINNRLTPDVLGSILKNLFLCSFARHHSFCLFLCFYPIFVSSRILRLQNCSQYLSKILFDSLRVNGFPFLQVCLTNLFKN